jgi:polyisoprenoid-binding protein YceI
MARSGFMIPMAMLVLILPATEVLAEEVCYQADVDRSELGFSGEAEGNPFEGQFGAFSVSVCLVGDDLTSASIDVRVETGSATVGNRQGDQALMDEELFYVEQFPEARWQSKTIECDGSDYRADGELTLRGISAAQPVYLQWSDTSSGHTLTGYAEILRLDYNVGIGEFEDTDFIRNRVDLEFVLELVVKD